MHRGQLSLSLVEAGVGVLVVFAVAATFVVGVPDPHAERAHLDRYASDAGVVLASDTAGAEVSLADALRSDDAFAARRDALERRAADLLPANVLYRVATPRGSFGHPAPPDRTVGTARLATRHGPVTIRVWYA